MLSLTALQIPLLNRVSGWQAAALLLLLLSLVFLVVLTLNYRRLRSEHFHPQLQEGEGIVDRLVADRWLSRDEHILTNRRLLQMHKRWLFSRRHVQGLSLEDATVVSLRRRMDVPLLVWALVSLGVNPIYVALTPLALLLFMLGVEGRRYQIRFDTHAFFPPRPNFVVQSQLRTQMGEFMRFYYRAQQAWEARRVEKGLPASLPAETPPDSDLVWGRPVWIAVGIYTLAALSQRVFQPHVSFDDYVFAPIYLGLAVGLARLGWHEAVWSAVLGMAAVLAVAFPGALPGDFPMMNLKQNLFLVSSVLGLAAVASVLARWLSPTWSFAALILWPLLVAAYDPRLFFNYAIYLRIVEAMLVAVVAGLVFPAEEATGPAAPRVATGALKLRQ